MSKLNVNELLHRYAQGERDFKRVQLKATCLKETNLSHIDLSQADLSYADLSGTNLSHAKLKQAKLHHTNLSGANLTRTNLYQANLYKTRLNHACLIGAFLTQARLHEASLVNTQLDNAHLNEAELHKTILDGASLNRAYLIGAYLSRASLKGANLEGTYLQGSKINETQFKGAYYNDQTRFEIDFDPANTGMEKVQMITIEELLGLLNHLSQCGSRYLGKTVTIKFWEAHRPNYDWFNHFEIDPSTAQFKFKGVTTYTVSILELYLSRKWMKNFINACSKMINNFSDLLDSENFRLDEIQNLNLS